MPSDLVKRNFAGGEISPQLYNDSRLYEGAVAEATNFFVDQRGGMSNRPGTAFLGAFGVTDWTIVKVFTFQFGVSTNTTYLIFLIKRRSTGACRFIFLQGGEWLTDTTTRALSGVSAAAPVRFTTAVNHGYSVNDLILISDIGATANNEYVFLENLMVQITAVPTLATFDAKWAGGGDISTVGITDIFASGNAKRVYSIDASALDTAGLCSDETVASQSRSVLTLTRLGKKTFELTRSSTGTWTLAEASYAPTVSRPGAPTLTPSGAGTAGVAFCITAVDKFGNESPASPYTFNVLSVDYASVAGSMRVTWAKVTGAIYYNVYRTAIFPIGADISRAAPVGFVGRAYGLNFTDRNIIPDYTITPPNYRTPFEPGAITFVEVTAAGAGYTRASNVTVTTATGSGFVGYAVVDSGGGLQGIVIENSGKGYVSTDTINVSVGAGATTTITVNDGDEYPAISGSFQQRKVLASTPDNQLSLELSKPGQPNNFSVSLIAQSDDALQFTLDTSRVSRFHHMIETRAGLLLMNQLGMWQLSASGGGAVTPSDALADPQSYSGVSDVPPMRVGPDLFFLKGKGIGVSFLTYNDWSKVYEASDVSFMAAHLFIEQVPVRKATYAEVPFSLFYFVREDGFAFNMAFNKQRELLGWSRLETQGSYRDILSIQEDDTDAVYQLVQRIAYKIGYDAPGDPFLSVFVEKVSERDTRRPWEFWFVDAGLRSGRTDNLDSLGNEVALTLSASSGNGVTVTAENLGGTTFVAGDANTTCIYTKGGKLRIKTFVNGNQVTADYVYSLLEPDVRNAAVSAPTEVAAGDWYMLTDAATFNGAVHLVNQQVAVLADGSYKGLKTVGKFGTIAIGETVNNVTTGLPYQGRIRTLPPKSQDGVLDGKLTRATKVIAQVVDTRGLKIGDSLLYLDEVRERTTEAYGEPTRLTTGSQIVAIESAFELDAGNWLVQDYPLPATITGLIAPTEVANET